MDPAFFLLSLRQNAANAILTVACFCALGVGYIVTATPLYTATSEIMVDTRLAQADDGEGGNRSLAELGMDAMSIDSQVAILTSQKLAIAVLKRLHLEDDEEFATPTTVPGLMLADLKRAFGPPHPELVDGIPADILDGFQKAVGASRVQQTYVIKVSFTAQNAQRAADIANAFVSVYSDAEIRSRMRARQVSERYTQMKLDQVRGRIDLATRAARRSQAAGDERGTDEARRNLEQLQASYAALATQADDALQHQVTPISAVSVLAEARAPTRKSQPNTLFVLLLSTVAGLASVCGLIAYKELSDRAYRLPTQIEAALRLRYVGMFPSVPAPGFLTRMLSRVGRKANKGTASSALAVETLHAMKIAAEVGTHNDELAVIGIVSAASSEGRSTVAEAFADVLAKAGERTLLVDADPRQPTLSRIHAPRSRTGLTDVLAGRTALSDAIVVRGDHLADLLPAKALADAGDTSLLHTKGMQSLLSEGARRYDVVVLDLPPLGAFTASAAFAPLIGAFFLVVEWGVTERSCIDAAVAGTPLLADRIAGFVFNKVDVGAFRRCARGSEDAVHMTLPRATVRFS